MPLTVPLSLALGRYKQLPQRAGEVWQGGLVRLPMWIAHATDPDGEPYRPSGALWVSLRTGLIHVALPEEGATASAEFALAALLEFGLKSLKGLDGRPARVEVRDPGLRDALAEVIGRMSTSVVVVDDMPAVREVLNNLEAEAAGGRRFPGLLESPGITPDRLRAFAQAAAAFYTAQVWDHLANEDLIVVESDGLPKEMRHLSVLGQGGQQFGVSFFESRKAFERVLDPAGAGRYASRAHGVTFGPIDELPFADVDAWLDHALPVAGPRAYPLAADLRRDGTVRRPDARELTCAEALLRALAGTTEPELDAGRWHKRVETADGAMELTLTLPLLLEAEAGQPSTGARVAAMPRAAERSSVRIARMMEGRAFESLDEVNEELDRAEERGLFDVPAEEASGRELTSLERAQELAYDAMEAEGRLRVKRARQALSMSADCADAWVILAEDASTPEMALERYEQSVAAGVRAIGDRFETLSGEFWGHLDTRPYMRARLGLAQTLRSLGRDDEALTHYRDLLRLNPNDNQGVRYLLVVALLELNRDDEAAALLEEHQDDIQALWPYARALCRFRTEGDTPSARTALDAALAANLHVVKYLLDPDALPVERPPHFALGSNEEAVYVAESLVDAYDATPGARPWLLTQVRSRRLRSRRSKRPTRRSGRRS
jgi:tetratricopeptide (TPR) repeat protein